MKSSTTPISEYIWESKYCWRENGQKLDKSIEQTWQRVAHAVAAIEPHSHDKWEQHFYQALVGFKFIPGGRILAGAGTDHRSTLFNCFVMGLIQDDMEHIFEALKQAALTMQAGGGVGYDFSTIRPKGSVAHSAGRIASGPVSFMHIWDAMCATMLSTGSRRGAMMASLRCDHPDIELFINAKRQAGHLRHFNLSVQVTDAFMQAVESDQDWPLVFPVEADQQTDNRVTLMRPWPGYETPVTCHVISRIPARELWQKIMQSAYDTSEPGILFNDRINEANNLAYCEQITTTNPCGEVPLPPYGACNLGSINLTSFVIEPFSQNARLDLESIRDITAIATRMLDNVIDCSGFPLKDQAQQAHGSRRIGLGITGLADTLIMLGFSYAEKNARDTAAQIMRTISHTAYRTSISLAKEKGSFPFFQKGPYLESHFVQSLPDDIHSAIKLHGIRNSHLIAIAPTGTISLLANNISSGIEPVFDFKVSRKILNRQGEYESFKLEDYAFRTWQDLASGSEELPAEFITAHKLSPLAQLQMQAELQPYVDNAISKTINIPQDYSFTDFLKVFETAWKLGLKGCTSFRANPVTGEILSTQVPCCDIEQEHQQNKSI